jgi:hypothetical protein
VPLFYSEWCDKHGYDYTDEAHRAAWEAYCKAEMRQPQPKIFPTLSGRITGTWMDDRAEGLRRRSYRRLYRILWPRQPLRIVRYSVASHPSQPTF